jgi:diamine N-acetyltransferase
MPNPESMASGFTIVDASAADAAVLSEIGARTFYDTFAPDNDPADMRKHLQSTFSAEIQRAEILDPALDTLLVRDADGATIAFAQLRGSDTADGVPATGSIELWRFYVDKQWQGRGVAHELMLGVKARARRRGANTLWLGVWQRNMRALAFYSKHGFQKVGSKVFLVGDDPQTDNVMLAHLG